MYFPLKSLQGQFSPNLVESSVKGELKIEGQLSVSGERMCTILVRGLSLPIESVVRLTDSA